MGGARQLGGPCLDGRRHSIWWDGKEVRGASGGEGRGAAPAVAPRIRPRCRAEVVVAGVRSGVGEAGHAGSGRRAALDIVGEGGERRTAPNPVCGGAVHGRWRRETMGSGQRGGMEAGGGPRMTGSCRRGELEAGAG